MLKNRLGINLPEKSILLAKKDSEIKIYEKKHLKSNELIEYVMILTNISVSETLNKNSAKFISRIHPSLDDLAITKLNNFLSSLNLKRVNCVLKATSNSN